MAAAGILLISAASVMGAATATLSNSLNPSIGAAGVLAAPATAALTNTGTLFNAYSGMISLQYLARTSSGGGGTLTLKVTQDFQTGGPSVAAGDLTYTCGAASLGTACGSTTASTSSATTVVSLPSSACTGGGSPCSATNPNTVALTFMLADKPVDQTGSYTATVQFTISAT